MLTIEPGVTVKANGQSVGMSIYGKLVAAGTETDRIVFTSLADDGVPGRWRNISVSKSGTAAPGEATFDWVIVRNGGYDCCGQSFQYGAIRLSSNSTASFDHSIISGNQHSGILASSGAAATVKRTLIESNAHGISVVSGRLDVSNGTLIRDNASEGIYFSLTSSTPAQPSTVMDSDIVANGRYGIYSLPTSLTSDRFPRGSRNNIYANAGSLPSYPDRQLQVGEDRSAIDWTENFWGSNVDLQANAAGCVFSPPYALSYLAYSWSTNNPPDGPISRRQYYHDNPFPQPDVVCYYDAVDASDFSATYISHGGDGPPDDYFAALASQFAPILLYDSGEQFHVLSPGALTDFFADDDQLASSNSLKDSSGEFAVANPFFWDFSGYAFDELDLDALGPSYATNEPNPSRRAGTDAAGTDFVSARGNHDDSFYDDDARTMEGRTGYPYKVYGRAVTHSDGKLWLQYWFFYYFNPDPVAPVLGNVHEGDWEMVQVGLMPDLTPEEAVYAQHESGQRCDWDSVHKEGGRPVVYVAEHSHASYFGTDPPVSYDHADGLGGGLQSPDLQMITDAEPAWVGWPGRWGDSDSGSPPGPRFQPDSKWSDPSAWAATTSGC
jgi:hypothetical protein